MSTEKSGLIEKALTERVIGGFFAVYWELGFGFLESVYENAMVIELRRAGIELVQQPPVEMFYLGHSIGQYRPDLVIPGRLLIEVKTVDSLAPTHDAQLLNYLRVTGLPLGLLFNFGPRAQFRRKINSRRP
jgi:GxxExxY protein